jgi:hypothetical protein
VARSMRFFRGQARARGAPLRAANPADRSVRRDAASLQVEAVGAEVYRGEQVGTRHRRKQLTPCG